MESQGGFPGVALPGGTEKGAPCAAAVEPFAAVLKRRGLPLLRGETGTLQVNTGLLCNLYCSHCHLEAGPGRKEVMSRETMKAVAAFARRFPFKVIDVTGGAPELVPDLPFLIENLAPLAPNVMLRTNLSALCGAELEPLVDLCVTKRVALVASFPSVDPAQTNLQRGEGAAEAGVAMLRKLNAKGYGLPGTGLLLHIAVNPVGGGLPEPQGQAERRFTIYMKRKWGISFNGLYCFANAPLGRHRKWLVDSGNHDCYMRTLAEGFSPCAVDGLMCRTLLSVSWNGFLYDCDFNLAAGRPLSGSPIHVSDASGPPPPGSPIEVGDHCYACTAGPGFT